MMNALTGSLIVVGTGIELVGQVTLAAKGAIEGADKVLFAVADPVTATWIRSLNDEAEPLPYDRDAGRRRRAYSAIVERIVSEVQSGTRVCAVFYGHPGVLTDAAHEAMRRVLALGLGARMLPGVSAEDCLFADLGIDPGKLGCQSFEATDFLIHRRRFDPSCALVLWQVAMIGNLGFYGDRDPRPGLRVLAETLTEHYPCAHEVVMYESAIFPTCPPSIQRVPLEAIDTATLSEVSTLYIPPAHPPAVDAAMMARLGMLAGA